MAHLQSASFSYEALDTSIRGYVQHKAHEIKAHMQRSAESIIVIGQALIDVKGQLGHGHFLGWIAAEFSMSERTARNFMGVARRFSGKSATLADLPMDVLYLLSSGKVPDAMVDQVIAGQIPASAVRERRQKGSSEAKSIYERLGVVLSELFDLWQASESEDDLLDEAIEAVETFISVCEEDTGLDAREALLLAAQALMEGVQRSNGDEE